MKKTILFGAMAIIVAGAANASDGVYYETETFTTNEIFKTDTVTYYDDAYIAPRMVETHASVVPTCGRVKSSMDVRPCAQRSAEPVRVKTHTEVIDHYQVYQPVVEYIPAGTYQTRRIINAPTPRCNRCNG